MSRIIVGVDPGPSGEAALDWALREAISSGASLLAVRAWSPGAYAMQAYMYAGGDAGSLESAEAQVEADEQLKLAVERVPGSDTVECVATAALGAAAQVLVERAGDGDMIVVGSRGHGALSRAVLGSVSSSVLHHATGPVTVVPASGAGDGTASRVIVGVDHSEASQAALAVAVDLARRRGVTLVPLHVHEPIQVSPSGAHPASLTLLEGSERHRIEAAARAAGAPDVVGEVVVGNPVVRLLAFAQPQDVIVVGSRGRGGFAGLLLGSTSTQLAQHATCPVLVVRA